MRGLWGGRKATQSAWQSPSELSVQQNGLVPANAVCSANSSHCMARARQYLEVCEDFSLGTAAPLVDSSGGAVASLCRRRSKAFADDENKVGLHLSRSRDGSHPIGPAPVSRQKSARESPRTRSARPRIISAIGHHDDRDAATRRSSRRAGDPVESLLRSAGL